MSSVDGESLTKVPTTPYPLVFLRCRTIAFCAITFFSFAWVVLLSIVIFMQWEFMDRSYQSTLLVMIAVYAITVVLLLVMLTRRFRAWLDAARFLLLIITHFGVSGAFAHYSRGFSCPQPTSEDRNICRVLILYILISSWLLPLLITIYTSALGITALYRWHLSRPTAGSSARPLDLDKGSLDLKLDLKHRHKSQTSSFGGPLPSPTPIATRFSTIQHLDIPNRFAAMPTPTTADFSGSSYYSASPIGATHASPAATPTSTAFPAHPTQAYLMPPPPSRSPTQLPYLMPPSPNSPGPQPYPTTPSNAQPYPTTPSNAQPYPTAPANPHPYPTTQNSPQSYPTTPRNPQPYPTAPSNLQPYPTTPSISQPYPLSSGNPQPYPVTPSNPQAFPMHSGNPYLTPNSINRQSRYSTHSNQSYSPPLHNPYLVPPLPRNWNHNPPPTRSRHHSIATTLHESIPEETSSMSGDSDYQKRVSARLSKPPPSTRMPSL